MTTPELRQKKEKNKKFCKGCEKDVLTSQFNYAVKEIGRLKNICKDCEKKYKAGYYARPDVIEKEQARAKQRTASGEWKDRYQAKKAGGDFKIGKKKP